MRLEEQQIPEPLTISQCCGTCAYWKRLTEYEGICTEGLSGTIDTTEIRWKCMRWSNLSAMPEIYEDFD